MCNIVELNQEEVSVVGGGNLINECAIVAAISASTAVLTLLVMKPVRAVIENEAAVAVIGFGIEIGINFGISKAFKVLWGTRNQENNEREVRASAPAAAY